MTQYRSGQGAAGAFFALGEAILVSGLGVVVGENSAANEVATKMRAP
jgi:hypothetical protein